MSLAPARRLQLDVLAQRAGLSMSALVEGWIAEHAAAEGVVVLPEDVERENERRRRIADERRHAAAEENGRTTRTETPT